MKRTYPLIHPTLLLCIVLMMPALRTNGQKNTQDIGARLATYNVAWDTPGPGSMESMPLGNGDIGLNVWVEPGGDIAMYISKTDAWSENNRGSYGLLKLGGMHISLSPNPFDADKSFLQVLKLHDGLIQIKEGKGTVINVWVDANNPVVRVAVSSDKAVTAKVTLDNWRTATKDGISADTILTGQNNRIAWYHRNGPRADSNVVGLTFGAIIKGKGLRTVDEKTLQSTTPDTSCLISLYPLTATTNSAVAWISKLEQQVANTDKLNLGNSYKAHQQWWHQFWNRSWVFATGDKEATEVTTGYILQRFVTACAGRGAYPIKFNGSIFNVDKPARKSGNKKTAVNADYRTWGGQYWFQNTRAMYWPRLMAGDFDMMLPLFRMYAAMIPSNSALIKKYYGHDGVYFAETAPFWGGLRYWGPEVKEDWTGHYFTPVLELSMMMLDYYEYTGDKQFAKDILLPVASAGLTFFDQHFKRDENGKILLNPDNSIEQYWKVSNPAPDIAGLHAVIRRLIGLPGNIVSASAKTSWEKMLQELPELPTGVDPKSQHKILLPYTGEQNAKPRNTENPELYAVYPFRIYGLGKPDLELALATFNARKMRAKGCWVQDPIQAALLGLPDVAKTYIHYSFTLKDPELKFPAFWAPRNDYEPDQDNGGNGENGLQLMLMQSEGKKILLLPAWPKEWEGEFKLNAPYKTTVQGKIVNGKLTDLVVIPASRKKDVVIMNGTQSPGAITGN